MERSTSTKRRLLFSMLSLLLCVSMLVSTTFAWFTDSISSVNNIIKSGNLDVELEYLDPNGNWKSVNNSSEIFDREALWEPGHTEVAYLRVSNLGTLALKYQLGVNIAAETEGTNVYGAEFRLSDYIYFGTVDGVKTAYADRAEARAAASAGLPIKMGFSKGGSINAGDDAHYIALVVYMPESVGNEANYMTGTPAPDITLGINCVATQYEFESDSFGTDYDKDATFPDNKINYNITVPVTLNPDNTTANALTFANSADGVLATVAAGTLVEPGTTELTLTVTELPSTNANISIDDGQGARSVDVHVSGIAAGNTQPVIVSIKALMRPGMNMGNYTLYHVEGATPVAMTYVAADADLDAHNEFTYDPVTGDVKMALASFSEVAVVAETVSKWDGKFDDSWYSADATELTIANADQLASLGAIVGGMKFTVNGAVKDYTENYDSFKGQTIKLITNIDLGDNESENVAAKIFYPIGYYNSDGTYEKTNTAITSNLRNFEGTFDGNGHTISNFYQNTWEMKGDHNWYAPEDQYYRDGMGLFGRVYGGTVKNLTVDHFSCDSEIGTTGTIAAYADCGATFENITIFNCNPRVYNIGNGGIVGAVGWYAKDAVDKKVTFTNITVDNTNKISALWGSYDVPCGGIVGQYYPTSGQSSANYPVNPGMHFENCHVAAQMDVYNDVCANYQYYAYRYAGMLIGSVRENVTGDDGRVYPKMDGITAEGCTVHFGTWNDYYYCELVDNTLASYTHDHQFSRLVEVKSVDTENKTYVDLAGNTHSVAASGRQNFVVVTGDHATENAECYHFKDGEVWTHAMGGYETGDINGDGVIDSDVLKEDNYHIYLEFNNLVTGYGWGVTTKGLEDFVGVDILDITEGEHEEAVSKFKPVINDNTKFSSESPVTIGDLFAAIDNAGVDIKSDNVQVTVSPFGANSTAGGTYVANTTDWTQGTLTFSGVGQAVISITDYYFCKATTITVIVVGADKFDTKFENNEEYLYRVGNADNSVVGLGTLFKHSGKGTINSPKVSVTFETIGGSASGAYSANSSDWTKGTIQFSGTGVVKVTIKDDTSNEFNLYLEVVDAKNATAKTEVTSQNVVLLSNVSGGFTVSGGWTLYGNGFKVTCFGDGSYRSAALSYGFITVETGGILDNVQVICDIFPESYLFTVEMKAGDDGRYPYGYSAVIISDGTISNSYIYGARNNIHVTGNATIKNTVTECGSLSNIHINGNSGHTVVLDNVTTIQYQTKSDYDTSKTVLGFGVLVGTNESASNANITLKGDLKQYNWVTSADTTSVSNTYAKTAIGSALKVEAYQHSINGTNNTVNMGIAILNELDIVIDDQRSNKDEIPYGLNTITMSGYKGKVYSIIGSENTENPAITADSRYNAETDGVTPYNPEKNNIILPVVKYNDTTNGLNLTYGYDSNKTRVQAELSVDLDTISGGTYSFAFSKLIAEKFGVSLNYVIKDSSGNVVDQNSTITLNQLVKHEYTLEIADNQIYNASGELSGETYTHSIPFILSATKTSINPPKFTNAGTATAIRLVTSKGGDWRPAYTALTGVSVTYWSASEGKVKTVDLSTLYNSGTISSNVWTYTCDDYTLTITGGAVHSDGTTITPVVAKNTLYFASTNKAFGTGTTSRSIILTYVFTDKNDSGTWNRTETVTYSNLSEYDYNSFKNNGTLSEPSSGGGTCLAEGTLITLADGTKRPVESLRQGDAVMAFDHLTGKIVYRDVIIVVKTQSAYYKNTFVFSDGTMLATINEHGIYDLDLGKYVNISHENAAEYIGHRFVSVDTQGNIGTKILVDVTSDYYESGYKYDIVTNGTLNYVAEDTLSVTHVLVDIINTFEFDDNMLYDSDKMTDDIEQYGLYTYDEWEEYCDITVFEEYNIPVMNIGVSKGLYTKDYIISLINTYVLDDGVQIID